jgi:3-deoxy-7-phosphoheptulonate synthase
MIAITSNTVSDERLSEIVQHIERHGVKAHVSKGIDRTVGNDGRGWQEAWVINYN